MNIKYLNFHDFTSELRLPETGELHLWTFAASDMDNLHKSLHEYSHALLNKILSAYTGIPSEKLEFGTENHGKPYLLSKKDIFFNLSHSNQYIVLLFSTHSPVGIDIEWTDRNTNIDKIATRMFLPEEAAYLRTLAGEAKKRQFFYYWTRTESFLKGIGTGLSVSFTDDDIQKEYSRWHIQSAAAPDGYVCTVAYQNSEN